MCAPGQTGPAAFCLLDLLPLLYLPSSFDKTLELVPLLRLSLTLSKFGLAFQAAAEDPSVVSKIDMFETSVIEIEAEGLQVFMEQLAMRAH